LKDRALSICISLDWCSSSSVYNVVEDAKEFFFDN